MAEEKHNWMWKVLASKGKTPSAKRLCGFIGWVVCQLVIVVVTVAAVVLKTLDIKILEEMFTTDAWVSAALLGVECVMSTFSKSPKTPKTNDDDNEDNGE